MLNVDKLSPVFLCFATQSPVVCVKILVIQGMSIIFRLKTSCTIDGGSCECPSRLHAQVGSRSGKLDTAE